MLGDWNASVRFLCSSLVPVLVAGITEALVACAAMDGSNRFVAFALRWCVSTARLSSHRHHIDQHLISRCGAVLAAPNARAPSSTGTFAAGVGGCCRGREHAHIAARERVQAVLDLSDDVYTMFERVKSRWNRLEGEVRTGHCGSCGRCAAVAVAAARTAKASPAAAGSSSSSSSNQCYSKDIRCSS